MSGAYTAQPAAVTVLDIPPGWSLTWPFPGAFPPGYPVNLILDPDITEEYPPGGTAENQKITLKDRQAEDWQTAEPVGDTISLTATMKSDDSVCELRESGGSFGTTVTKSYSAYGNLWALQADLEFDVDSDDIEDFIVLRYQSTPLSQEEIDATSDILVVSDWTWTARLTYTITDVLQMHPDGNYGGFVQFQKKDAGWGGGVWPQCLVFNAKNDNVIRTPRWENYSSLINKNGDYEPEEAPFDFGVRMQDLTIPPDTGDDTDPWILDTLQEDGTMIIEVDDLGTDYDWYVGYGYRAIDTEGPSVTFTHTLQLYKGGQLQSTNTFEIVKNDNDAASAGYSTPILKWEIDKTTKAVTTY